MISRRALLAAAILTPIAARAETSPADPIQALNAALLIVMRMGRARPFADRMKVMTPVVQASFNLKLLLRNSLGPGHLDAIPAAQQAELLDVFTEFTVASYVANFDGFSGETFPISPELRQVGTDQIVQTRIVPAAGEPTRLDYVMRQTDGAWQVVDILFNGSISRVAVTRSDFRALLKGNDASALIRSLRDKVAGFAAGNAT